MPQVSIIIPIYNSEKYLKKCLDSILNQDLSAIEIICIDDGSQDGSWQILQDYAARDQRLCCYTQPNQGVSSARNYGLSHATGKYILFVDADDYLAENCLAELSAIATKNNLDMLVFGYYHINNGNISESAFIKIWKEKLPHTPFSFEFNQSFLLNGSVWNKLISRKLIEAAKATFPPNVAYAEDTIFCFRLYPFIKKMQILPKAFYYYQNHESDSLSCETNVFSTLFNLFSKFISTVPSTQTLAAMDYWCNFFTWNLLKKEEKLTNSDYAIMQNFLQKFNAFDKKSCRNLKHYQRLKQEIARHYKI